MTETLNSQIKVLEDLLEKAKTKSKKIENSIKEKEATHLKIRKDAEEIIAKFEEKAKKNGEASQIFQQSFMETNGEIFKLEHQLEILNKLKIDAVT